MGEVDFSKLYDPSDKDVMKIAEDSLDPKLDRVQEIIEFARVAGMKKIGIANCITFNKEAVTLEKILTDSGFTVNKVNCKYGRVPFNDLLPDYKGVSCNPAGQADYLAKEKTELNIVMGLCLGHDMIFNSKSEAPVTSIIVKDRKLNHHTLGKLYE
jgi:uncharacterized metal-binding protein